MLKFENKKALDEVTKIVTRAHNASVQAMSRKTRRADPELKSLATLKRVFEESETNCPMQLKRQELRTLQNLLTVTHDTLVGSVIPTYLERIDSEGDTAMVNKYKEYVNVAKERVHTLKNVLIMIGRNL